MMKSIIVEGISKKYRIGNTYSPTLRGTLKNVFSKRSNRTDFWALKDISFELDQGEALGIIGRNGAGKSTLLKILSRITSPTSGRAILNGRVSSLLEVGTGFHGELTGRENVYLNGSLLGMTRMEIKQSFDEIVHFSGVEKFIDTPVKNYSSGMYVRLAFSVAAHLKNEILIVDEVLAVGDAAFQQKCLDKLDGIVDSGRTLLFVSHDLDLINQLCQKSILIDQGQLVSLSKTADVIDQYLTNDSMPTKSNQRTEKYKIKRFDITPVQPSINFSERNGLTMRFDVFSQLSFNFKDLIIHVAINDANGRRVGFMEDVLRSIQKGKSSLIVELKYWPYKVGQYYLTLWCSNGKETVFNVENILEIHYTNNKPILSDGNILVDLEYDIKTDNDE